MLGDISTMMPDDDTTTRAFAWARAYLAVHNTMAAAMCLRRVFKTTAPADMNDRGQDAVRLAGEIAMQHMQGGNVDDASKLLELAASWARGERHVRSKAVAEKVIVARAPFTRLQPKPPPEPAQAHDEIEIEIDLDPDPNENESTVGHFENDVTRIYRPAPPGADSGTVIAHTIHPPRGNPYSPRYRSTFHTQV